MSLAFDRNLAEKSAFLSASEAPEKIGKLLGKTYLCCVYSEHFPSMKELDKRRDTDRIEHGVLQVRGARVHNLKNIDADLPRNSLCVLTGLSGSGKSSLAFDTIFAEGSRRYIETFSSYARGFLGNMERPDVDKITGLSPVISIEQKTTNKNPRSTVGTTTEIFDFLRLLYARVATAYSYNTGRPMVRYTEEQIVSSICSAFEGQKIYLLAPVVKDRKGHYRELLEQLRKKGYLNVRIDGQMREIERNMALSRYQIHRIEVVIDRIKVSDSSESRIKESVRTALKQGKDQMVVITFDDPDTPHYYSRSLMCPTTGLSYSEPAPHSFSFNSPRGACPKCKGLGQVTALQAEKIFPNPKLSIRDGGIEPIGKLKRNMIFAQLMAICEHYGFSIDDPVGELPEELIDDILNGTNYTLNRPKEIPSGMLPEKLLEYNGLAEYINRYAEMEESHAARKWAEQFSTHVQCPLCMGKRLKTESLHFKIDGKDIMEVSSLHLPDFKEWIKSLKTKFDSRQWSIAEEIIKEIDARTDFLLDVGLDYLSLNRSSGSLSGGESQRIRLATQIGSKLVNVLYILDEPSIGLHQRDNVKLIHSLKNLRDQGNSLIVVEHDKDMMLEADYVVDLGPGAGRKGGRVVFAGTPKEMLEQDTLTAQYLKGTKRIEVPASRRKGSGELLVLKGATGNNLKGDTMRLPIGTLTCITGVSGSGKSSLINSTLYPILSQHFYRSQTAPLPYEEIEGLEYIDKVVAVDQSPIGRMPRSNPATYVGIFTLIRSLFVELPESKMRGYKPGRFSFNIKGGRCETCKGNGYKTIEMNFLPDVYVPCEACKGKRYNRETLEVRYKGKSISDILDMTVNRAVEFFENNPSILKKIKTLQDVGLGYIKLGQPSSTLSGGECQRIKLATELSKRDTGKTIYFLDEPTTGLHFEDIRMLLNILQSLVDRGNTVVVIEHNLDVIKSADYIIDLGPEGGTGGGEIIFQGTPEEMTAPEVLSKSHTAYFLNKEL